MNVYNMWLDSFFSGGHTIKQAKKTRITALLRQKNYISR